MAQPIKNKRDFVERYRRGEFGNASPTWPTLRDWLNDDPPGGSQLYHFRNKQAGGKTHYDLTIKKALKLSETIVDWDSFYVSAMAPTEKTTLQGELRLTPEGMELLATRVKKPMRDALREHSFTTVGLMAKLFLQEYMNGVSYDWMQHLIDEYPNHIIEFSCYSTLWGTLEGYNTVFWEVRPDRSVSSNLSPHTQVY